MEFASHINLASLAQQVLVGLSRTTILFIVSSGLSLILGVLRIPNVSHGSLYMIGAFITYAVASVIGGATGFWVALVIAPLAVAGISLVTERALFCHLYEREHLMLLLFTFALALVFGDLVKLIWGADYRSLNAPEMLRGSVAMGSLPFPRYNLFLLMVGPVVAFGLWYLTNKTKIGKIARAAAVDREMVAAMGINVSWVFAFVFCIGCLLAGLGGALGGPHPKHHPGHGPRHHHGMLPHRNHRRPGQHMGRAFGRGHIRAHRLHRHSGLAPNSPSCSPISRWWWCCFSGPRGLLRSTW